MPYTISGNSMLEIQIVGRLHGQRTRNVFHYLYPPDGVDLADGKTAAETAVDDFVATILNPLLGLTCEEWTVERVTGQWVLPDRYRAVANTTGWVGGLAGACLPSYCAVNIAKFAELSGPAYQGRNFYPGIAALHEDDSRIEAVALDDWEDFAAQLILPLNLGIPASDIFLVTKTPESAMPIDVSSIVTETRVDPFLRVQRRREVGVGE